MSDTPEPHPSVRSYFVDEAGDGTLFSRKGDVILGTEGCSRFFILGFLDVPDPDGLSRDLQRLRARLLADPYFASVPSMQPEAKKTALAFHAKDDLAEVRREVFALLRDRDIRFFAAVKDKLTVLDYVRHQNQREPAYRYHANELYDYTVRRLFKTRLHKADEYRIWFARRGSSDRTAALRSALETTREWFAEQWGVDTRAELRVIPASPHQQPCLQATDYFLWALQRMYERRESRFVDLLWPQVGLVYDIDDRREERYGVFYNQKRPLTLAALDGRQEI